MTDSGLSDARPLLNWMEIGDRPVAVAEWEARRFAVVQRIGSWVGGFVFGGVVGLLASYLVYGRGFWPPNLPIFFAAGVPVGIGEFFFTRWFLLNIARAANLRAKRVAISGPLLHIELIAGNVVEWPLKSVHVSKDPIAGGWYTVSLPAGRTSLSFWAPPLIATSIRNAAPG